MTTSICFTYELHDIFIQTVITGDPEQSDTASALPPLFGTSSIFWPRRDRFSPFGIYAVFTRSHLDDGRWAYLSELLQQQELTATRNLPSKTSSQLPTAANDEDVVNLTRVGVNDMR